jgi:hypothetical protein
LAGRARFCEFRGRTRRCHARPMVSCWRIGSNGQDTHLDDLVFCQFGHGPFEGERCCTGACRACHDSASSPGGANATLVPHPHTHSLSLTLNNIHSHNPGTSSAWYVPRAARNVKCDGRAGCQNGWTGLQMMQQSNCDGFSYQSNQKAWQDRGPSNMLAGHHANFTTVWPQVHASERHHVNRIAANAVPR